MTTSIKDTVHGYVELDPFEKKVVDSPWFQRLRRVRQNDVCSFVYPTMLTTRFEHSLGAMHIAGECLKAALEDPETIDSQQKFLRQLRSELSNVLGVKPAANKLALFARRAARMYGALHDIGHPPYSHLIESCYKPTDIGLKKSMGRHWHETNGAEIVERLLPVSVSADGEDADILKTAAHLSSKGEKTPALLAIKKLVDAVIDADRMDFVLRDGRNSGSEFGIYDLRRLIDSFRVHVVDIGGVVHTVLIRPLNKALSAIESLIQERYKIYRWVLFHHRVMQSRALMRYVMMQTRSDTSFNLKQFQAQNYVPPERAKPSEDKFDYVMLGDGIVDQHLDKHLRRLRSKTSSLSVRDQRLLTALQILVLRSRLGIPLWKRSDEYNGGRDQNSFENKLREAFRNVSPPPPHERLTEKHRSYANWIAAVLNGEGTAHSETIVNILNAGSGPEWYLLEIPVFKTTGDDRILRRDSGELSPAHLSDMSSIARAIDAARRDDVHLFAFCFTSKEVEPEQVNQLIVSGRTKIAQVIASYYQSSDAVRQEFDAST